MVEAFKNRACEFLRTNKNINTSKKSMYSSETTLSARRFAACCES